MLSAVSPELRAAAEREGRFPSNAVAAVHDRIRTAPQDFLDAVTLRSGCIPLEAPSTLVRGFYDSLPLRG
jgi:hypothetical protein